MRQAKDIIKFTNDLVSQYSKFDISINQYTIDISDIPDFDQQKLSALLMSSDEILSSEATGPDNNDYYRKMLPSLLNFLRNSTDKDKEVEFVKAWRDGVTRYFNSTMQKILDDAVYDRNDRECLLRIERNVIRERTNSEVNLWL